MKIIDVIGDTPLVEISTPRESGKVFVKVESFNAGGSIKSRVAQHMVVHAEMEGQLHPGDTIVEPTGGNTGIGLALAAAIRGYHFVATVPDNYSARRVNLLRVHGAEVHLSNSSLGNDSHIKLAKQILISHPEYVHLDQFTNLACIAAHYEGTGQEILKKCVPDVFVCSVGSGATFTGVGRCLRDAKPDVKLYVVQPLGADIVEGTSVSHSIQGTSLGIKPPLMDYAILDGTIEVTWDDVKSELHDLARVEGLYLGPSSGANIWAARMLAAKMGRGVVVCTVAPDGGYYYPEVFEK